ncbi:MAG: 30S ribosomal protein S12 methylthiotransferase RimO [Desulfobulbaceae bacterium]|uniref:Ribosomal protein uS12 methylthiotransferase RimO n=1 Tax=Candidatus Desulfobia pelagia TaxID=2841692 RepID=A0A8J6NGK7_9BACT|nr:30S ribosomal protein S12 methylthiotransferase RimO [Candidatus Desulfobia pelagia]
MVSLGCPKNLVDSEVMLALLEQDGLTVVSEPENAAILVVNTCGFIQSAVEEAIDEILALSEIKKQNPGVLLVVTGCLVQRYGSDLKAELPEVDIFIGTEGFQNIIPVLAAQTAKPSKVLHLETPHFIMNHETPRRISTPSHRAYLKISEGCSNRCTYCMIPGIRGPLRSRDIKDITSEAQQLGHSGVRELTLIGQDVTAYGIDFKKSDIHLIALLENLLHNTSIDWIRLLYLYPDKVGDDLLKLLAAEKRLTNYLDIPLQHVSDTILKRMGRPSRNADLCRLLERIRTLNPDAAVRTTFMIGFPGETDADVAMLADFMQSFKLDNVGLFTYSNEEGCAASHYTDQCSEEIKQERYSSLMELQAGISLEKNRELVGKTLPVLVEGISRESDLLLEGRTERQAADIDGCVYINEGTCQAGEIIDVTISEAHPYDLVGSITQTK